MVAPVWKLEGRAAGADEAAPQPAGAAVPAVCAAAALKRRRQHPIGQAGRLAPAIRQQLRAAAAGANLKTTCLPQGSLVNHHSRCCFATAAESAGFCMRWPR